MDADARIDELVRLLAQNQRRLFLYVRTLVPNHADAEEVLQNTNLVLWREFGTFEPGTNFAAWSCRVALNQVLAWRKKRQRDRLQFSDELLALVATAAEDAADALEERSRALAGCLEKLPAEQRELVRLREERPDVDRSPHSQAATIDRAQLECGQEFKRVCVKKALMRAPLRPPPRPHTSAAPLLRATARGT